MTECYVLFGNPFAKDPRDRVKAEKVLAEMSETVAGVWGIVVEVCRKYNVKKEP